MTRRSALLALALACDPAPAPPPPAPVAPAPVAAPAPAPAPLAPEALTLAVLDRATLDALEAPAMGWSFGAVMARASGAPAPDEARPDLSSLTTQAPAWRALSGRLATDIDAAIAPIERPLVTELADALRFPAGNVGRRLDLRWLSSPDAHLSLAGVVNRLDRRDLLPAPSCGEVRLVYRLAYTQTRDGGAAVGSRLPLTLNVVLVPEADDCASVARTWAHLPTGPGAAEALAQGPLAGLRLDRVEVNAQVVRFPSGLETEFAGQALYLLRVYRFEEATEPDSGVAVAPVPLENTPDVARLRADPAARADLAGWIQANLGDIDRGTYRLPARFSADAALSWSTLGVNRSANHAFSAIFLEDEAALPDPAGAPDLRFVASRRGLLERLDSGTCMGCHQAASTAGFHLLGPDGATAGVTNRLASPRSPHLSADLPRRRAYAAAVASGLVPDRTRAHPLAPPPADRPAAIAINQPCLPAVHQGDLQPGVAGACSQATGPTACEVVAADPATALNWGQCVPADPALLSGLTCRVGAITARAPSTEGAFNQHAYADTAALTQRYDLPEDKTFAADALNCRPTRIGVPLGRTYRRCSADERALTGVMGDNGALSPDLCAVVGGAKFDRCVAEDFHACLEQIVGRGMVATCSAAVPCREDMICQQLPWQLEGVPDDAGRALTEAGVGFCTPTYFLFQLRLDGHPVPRSG